MIEPNLAELFAYDAWPSRLGQNWGGARHDGPFDSLDFHVDLGCGRLPKARIGVDRYPCPGVGVVMDLGDPNSMIALPREPGADALLEDMRFFRSRIPAPGRPSRVGLPFEDSSIESIISAHFFEHIGEGFIPLVEECYRVLKPGGLLRAITPLFPSWAAVSDPDHRRHFMADHNPAAGIGKVSTWDAFCGTPGDEGSWLNSFSVPYTTARFECVDIDYTPPVGPEFQWGWQDVRELRVALVANK